MMASEDLVGLFGSVALLLASVLLSVLSALLDRSGSIRLRHWAGEAGGRIGALFHRPVDFELFRTLLSWAATASLIGSLVVLIAVVEVAWNPLNITLVALGLGAVVLGVEIFARARVGHDPEGALRRSTLLFRAALLFLRPWIFLFRPLLPDSAIQRRDEDGPDEATNAEIEAYLRVGEREGILEPGEDEMVRGIVDFGETEVRSVMVPRTDMVTASPHDDPGTLADLFLETGHSRLPLYDEDEDQVLGILHLRNLLQGLRSDPAAPVDQLARKPLFVAETTRLDDLLRDMQSRHEQMAVVVDEYGGIAGVVTIEDLLEEIVGEIRDEYDAPGEPVEKLGQEGWRIDGGATLDDLEDLFGIEFTETSATTVAGLILEVLGRIPSAGDRVEIQGVALTVERVRHRRVRSVRAERQANPDEDSAERVDR